MPWLQLFADTDNHHAPAVEKAFLGAGAVSVTFKEFIPSGQEENPILEPKLGETPLWTHTRVVGLFDGHADTTVINHNLQSQHPDITLRWEQLEDKDWEREWMKNYHPIQCADTLWICPSWISPPDPEATNILLDPGLAFGTGTHPTTFLCLQWLADQALKDKTLMDYGCGSGILGVAGLLLGAKSAVGVDLDPQALIATQDNLQRNNLDSPLFNVYQPEDCPSESVDIMMANILAGPLVELADTLLALTKPGASICLSGILYHQANAVIEAYEHEILFDPISRKDEWVRLTGTKK